MLPCPWRRGQYLVSRLMDRREMRGSEQWMIDGTRVNTSAQLAKIGIEGDGYRRFGRGCVTGAYPPHARDAAVIQVGDQCGLAAKPSRLLRTIDEQAALLSGQRRSAKRLGDCFLAIDFSAGPFELAVAE